ncbi:MAG: glycosyltransferase [Candidatus Pacebacteria bacterium]|nr:glycosyltransferase [Candidatus Paceibacterota bacterium]
MKKVNEPLVSLIMPVFNTGHFLSEAIKSLREQTYSNWELVIVDDNSTDNSPSLLKTISKKDKRIKVFYNKENKGVSYCANLAISKVKGQYIARMDSDDIAASDRLEKQLAYLVKNTEVVAVGGQCEVINADGQSIGTKKFPTDSNEAAKMLFSFASIQQPAMMVNSRLLPKDFIWYDESLRAGEEHELLFKFLQYGQLANLSETVLGYRMHGENISTKHPKKDFFNIINARIKAVREYGYRPTLKAVLTNIVQMIVVGILPEKLFYSLYSFLRGLSNRSDKLLTFSKTEIKEPKKLSSLSVFFPMHNEEANVRRAIKQAQSVLPNVASYYEIIIVNDGSSDKTSQIAHSMAKKDSHIKVIDQVNLGYGGALQAGFKAAKYQWVFFTDGDLQFDLNELKLFVPKTLNNQVVLGYRKHRADTNNRIVLATLLKIWNKFFFRFPSKIKDIDCAFKLFHRDVVGDIFPLNSVGAMISTEILLKIVDGGYNFTQIGVTHLPRLYGEETGAKMNVILGAVKETFYLYYKRNLEYFVKSFNTYAPYGLAVFLSAILYTGFSSKK